MLRVNAIESLVRSMILLAEQELECQDLLQSTLFSASCMLKKIRCVWYVTEEIEF